MNSEDEKLAEPIVPQVAETQPAEDVQVEPALSAMPATDEPTPPPKTARGKKQKRYIIKNKIVREIVSWTATILIAILIAVFINAYGIRTSRVDGDSMQPTLQHGQTLLISRVPYIFGNPAYGDIVVFDSEKVDRTFLVELKESLQYNVLTHNLFDVDYPNKYWIKRVVGRPGDTIEIKEDGVYRNGKLLEEPYAQYTASDANYSKQWVGHSWTLEEDDYFVMGDNRNHSSDSRVIGVIPGGAIIGKVVKQ